MTIFVEPISRRLSEVFGGGGLYQEVVPSATVITTQPSSLYLV